MCGITGAWQRERASLEERVGVACDALRHRGPDSGGCWVHPRLPLAFGHRRLAILDLSPTGNQPMSSPSGRFTVTYNGEIYNYRDLARELTADGAGKLRGTSDTEILLLAFEHWGIKVALTRLVGMFALGVWDEQEGRLVLARDRFGEKPLYYGWSEGSFAFASELKAILTLPTFRPSIDRAALSEFIATGYIAAPHSIFEGIYKLPPSTHLSFTPQELARKPANYSPYAAGASLAPEHYWSLRAVVEAGLGHPFLGSFDDAVAHTEELIARSVTAQMVADVPVGAFLSGGIDSSTICALMRKSAHGKVRTFSIGFEERDYNEAHHARQVAQHLGTDHTERIVSARDAIEVIPRLPRIYDEPFADSSQIPTVLLSELARGAVTVSLSGDAGDELFGGYPRYFWTARLWRTLGWLPRRLRSVLFQAMAAPQAATWQRLYNMVESVIPTGLKVTRFGKLISRAEGVMTGRDLLDAYVRVLSFFLTPEKVVLGEPRLRISDHHALFPGVLEPVLGMMAFDTAHYLPDDILVKVDRASMSVGLESRVPLLDHRLVEFLWTVPAKYRARDGSKLMLRQILKRYVPTDLIDRPKMGFGVPVGAWLRGDLRSWAEDLLSVERLSREQMFHPAHVRKLWSEHLSGRRDHEHVLWHLLMFQAWRAEYMT